MSTPAEGNQQTSPLLPSELGTEAQTKLTRIGSPSINTERPVIGIGFTWLTSFLAALDSTITSTLSSTIASEFHSLAIISWLGSAYLIAITTTQPLSGKLTDIFGRRSGFIFSLILFGVGNLVCGMAGSRATIVLGRALAGIGGGGCNSISTFIASDLIPPRRRGLWHGMGMIVVSAGIGLGGVVGGVINENWGWRWAFIVLIPFTVISGIGVVTFLPAHGPSQEQSLGSRLGRIDFGGCVVLVLALALLLIGLNQDDFNTASSRRILGIVLPLAAVSFIVFILIELYWAREPVFPIDLLAKRTVSGACLASAFISMSIYTLMFHVPLYFQLRGNNTSHAGILFLPEPIGAGIGSFTAGIIMRRTGRYGILKTFAFGLYVAGNAGLATVSMRTSFALPEMYLFTYGLGLGGILTVMLLALLSSVEHEDQAVTTSIQYAFRSTGATLGVALSSVVFRNLLKSRLGEAAVPGVPSWHDILRGCSTPNQEGHADCPHLTDGFMYALHGTFLLAVGFATAGFVTAMTTKNYPLRATLKNEEPEGDGAK